MNERFEKEMDILKTTNRLLKDQCEKYNRELTILKEEYRKDHQKYSDTTELLRIKVTESNNRLRNFSALFERLGKDMRYLNETTQLVHFAEDSEEFLRDTQFILPFNKNFSMDDSKDDSKDEDIEYCYDEDEDAT